MALQREIHNLRCQNASLRMEKSKIKQYAEEMTRKNEELRVMNRKLENMRMREREYSARLEAELDKLIKQVRKQK